MVAATGHENGDALLWGIQWNGVDSERSESIRRPGSGEIHTRSAGGRGGGGGGSSVGVGADVRPLKLLRVLSGPHQKRITFVRVCEGGREMLVGDCLGGISRWQCIRLDQLSSEELNQLV